MRKIYVELGGGLEVVSSCSGIDSTTMEGLERVSDQRVRNTEGLLDGLEVKMSLVKAEIDSEIGKQRY